MDKCRVYKEGLQEAASQIAALIERYEDDEVAGYLRMIDAHITGTFMEADGLSAEPKAPPQSELCVAARNALGAMVRVHGGLTDPKGSDLAEMISRLDAAIQKAEFSPNRGAEP